MEPRITAVLGPTNTGKTTLAIERMLAYRSGIIGLPLRLLAREVYDRIVAMRGPSVVALVTGEERIVPDRVAYWVCTVEAMPQGLGCDFVAVDEIQLCADPDRGHVFTDRLLHMRGTAETMFLGADTMRGPISHLIPNAEHVRRERFSQLAYSGSKKISRMPARSAIVGFSVENVYAIGELLRRQKGGAAIVMGALSPRTRNAQVEMYQSGEVDYLVATDAIGMGLNLDIKHIAFSSLTKFDGRRMRPLEPQELAQIAGRAGRGETPGTFGTTGEAPAISDDVAEAITSHSFRPLKRLFWRSTDLRFGSPTTLIRSLEAPTDHELLSRVRESDDLAALKAISQDAEVAARASDPASVRLLWDVCQIPDFRGISPGEHATMLTTIYNFLHEKGTIPDDFLARQLARIDRTDGDVDTLSKRVAYVRTWTYVAQRRGWTRDFDRWRDRTRAVEDRLSDALHGALTQRFVDRRTSVLLRRLKQKEAIVAEVNDKGEVTIDDQFIGRLEGFRFRQDKAATADEAKTLRAAAIAALTPEFHLRADRLYNAPDPELDFTEQGGLMWGDQALGKLVAGDAPLRPRVEVFVDDEAGPEVAQKVQRRLQVFIDRKIATAFEPLFALEQDAELTGLAKGFAYQMVEAMGVIPRGAVAQDVKALDQDARKGLRKHGLRFGQFTIFMHPLLKPAPTRLRLVLWGLAKGLGEFPEAPPPGLVTVPAPRDVPDGFYAMAGYRAAGDRMIRIDMLERLADMLRDKDSRGGFEATADMLSITGLTLEQFAGLMQGLGYKVEQGEREKVKPVIDPAAGAIDAPAEGSDDAAKAAAATDSSDTDSTDSDSAPSDSADSGETLPADASADAQAADAPAADTPMPDTGAEPAATAAPEAQADATPEADSPAVETEVFYTFTWAGRRGGNQARGQGARRRDDAPQGKRGGKPGDKGKPGAKGKAKGGPRQGKPQSFSAKPAPKKDRIDPDNPFAAALAGLKKG